MGRPREHRLVAQSAIEDVEGDQMKSDRSSNGSLSRIAWTDVRAWRKTRSPGEKPHAEHRRSCLILGNDDKARIAPFVPGAE